MGWLAIETVAIAEPNTSQPPSIQESKAHIIVMFGDSTSAPRDHVRVFAAILKSRLTDVKIINAGVPGNTTRDALKRLNEDVLSHHPDMVTIFFGINDSAVDVWKGATKPRVSLQEYEANLRQIIIAVRRCGARPILMTPNPVIWTPALLKYYGRPPYQPKDSDGWNVVLKHYADAVRKIAMESHVPLADVDRLFRGYAAMPGHHLNDLLLDGMHPNDRGHQIIADRIVQCLKEAQ